MLQEAMRRFPFDTALLALNAADIHCLAFIPTALADATQREMGMIGMKIYAQGALLGPDKLTAEEAMRYVLSLPGVSTVVVGCRTPAEVDDNVRIARQFAAFDPQHLHRLETQTQPWGIASPAGSAGVWWPADLGLSAASGAQNAMRYGSFPVQRRLAISYRQGPDQPLRGSTAPR
jgi:hypothetical protein